MDREGAEVVKQSHNTGVNMFGKATGKMQLFAQD